MPNPTVTSYLLPIFTHSCMFEVTSIIPCIAAIPDSVLFSVNCASAYVQIKTTCMVLALARSIFAGGCDLEAVTSVPDRRTTDKNIYVLPLVLLRVYARSKQHRILSRQRLRVETKRFSTRRYMVWSRMSLLALTLPAVFSRFVGALACSPTLT